MGCHEAHKGGFLEEVMPQHLDDEKVTAARGEGKSISSLNECSRGEEHGDAFRFHGAMFSLFVYTPCPGFLSE